MKDLLSTTEIVWIDIRIMDIMVEIMVKIIIMRIMQLADLIRTMEKQETIIKNMVKTTEDTGMTEDTV